MENNQSIEIISPKLKEFIIQTAQWNMNAYTIFSNFVVNIKDERTQNQIAAMLSIGKQNNQQVLDYLTKKPGNVRVQ